MFHFLLILFFIYTLGVLGILLFYLIVEMIRDLEINANACRGWLYAEICACAAGIGVILAAIYFTIW